MKRKPFFTFESTEKGGNKNEKGFEKACYACQSDGSAVLVRRQIPV